MDKASPSREDDLRAAEPSDLAPAEARVDRYELRFEVIRDVRPLGTQIGVFPKMAAPAALHEPLFGQPKRIKHVPDTNKPDTNKMAYAPPLLTYAILDAAKIPNLPELLARSGLQFRCLFKGEAFDELKDVAPWIVALDQEDSFTRNLFTDSEAPWHLWSAQAGIFLRSTATLEELWRHFRKFTRVPDAAGKWYYWRFWEPAALPEVLASLQNDEFESFARPVSYLISIEEHKGLAHCAYPVKLRL